MSSKNPSLFDDFFFEEEKKEDLFPDVPHVYDPEQNRENIEREKIEGEEQKETVESDEEESESSKHLRDDLLSEDKIAEQHAQLKSSLEPSLFHIKKPSLELPSDSDLDQQIKQEGIRSDYFGFIHKDFPFNPAEIETIEKESSLPSDVEIIEQPLSVSEDTAEEVSSAQEEEKAIPFPQWELKKNYYSIGEVAKLFEVNISHIRFWTNEFKLNPRTNRKGDRLYNPELINELRLIHYLVKVKKHTIKGAKEKLKNQKITVENNLGLKESLLELRDFLVSLKQELQ